MHVPKPYQQQDQAALINLMRDYPFATLTAYGSAGLEAHHLPVSVIIEDDKLYLQAHIARVNPLWQTVADGAEVLLVFHGPSGYISPNHYPTKQQTGKAVPTWNYTAVHARGQIAFIHDAAWLYSALETLTAEHESKIISANAPWQMSDAPKRYVDRLLPAIVGIKVEVTSLTGQWKLSQDKPEVDQQGVIAGLLAQQETAPPRALVDYMQALYPRKSETS